MITFKCVRCNRVVNSMKEHGRLTDTRRVLEYVAIYPDLDEKTMSTIYKCGCGRLNTYMDMVEINE